MNNNQYDIIVVGGGISGAIASIAAARLGSKVLIVEQRACLGGMLTTSGVGPMMTFHAGEKQVIQGITGELIDRLVAKGKSPGHIFDTTGYTYSVTPFDAEAMKFELEKMLQEAGGDILFHTMLAEVKTTADNNIGKIRICNKAGLSWLKAKVYIDATGDADLAYMSGVPTIKGRSGDGLAQPMTMKLRMYNVDIASIKNFIKENPDEFPRLKGDTSIVDRSERLSIGGFTNILKKARETGEISFQREDVLFFEANNPGEVIINTSRITGLDSTNPEELSKAEIIGRKQVVELVSFLKKRIPGFEHAELAYSGPNIGVRSSRQIVGEYTITREDVLRATKFEDMVVCNGYPIDVHSPTGINENYTEQGHLSWGEYYSIPYRSLVSRKVKNLITVGRAISGEFDAQAAFRTSPGAGAIGHAGGVAAHLAVQVNNDLLKVKYTDLRQQLLTQKAYLND